MATVEGAQAVGLGDVENGRVTTVDEGQVRAEAQAAVEALSQRAENDPTMAQIELAEAMEKRHL